MHPELFSTSSDSNASPVSPTDRADCWWNLQDCTSLITLTRPEEDQANEGEYCLYEVSEAPVTKCLTRSLVRCETPSPIRLGERNSILARR